MTIIKSVRTAVNPGSGEADTIIVEFTPEFSSVIAKKLTIPSWGRAFWEELGAHFPFDHEAEQKQIEELTRRIFGE